MQNKLMLLYLMLFFPLFGEDAASCADLELKNLKPAAARAKTPKDDFAMHDPFNGAVRVKTFSFENNEDQDFDEQPDDWVRRKGEDFPHYIKASIDRKEGAVGKQSLRMTANGGQAAYYSPQIPVDADHSFVFEGQIKTVGLRRTAAVITVSFLNHQRQRLQRIVSNPISGTHAGFQKINLGPIFPHQDSRFCVIGCHLINSDEFDIEGDAWFDGLWLGKLPRFGQQTNFETQFRQANAPIQIKTNVTGLDPGFKYRIEQELKDHENKTLARNMHELTVDLQEKSVDPDGNILEKTSKKEPIIWQIPSQSTGYYRVHSQLIRNEETIVDTITSFVVLDLNKPRDTKGEFGWSMPDGADHIPVIDLVNITRESGIHYLKYPVWKQSDINQQQVRVHTGIFLNEILSEGITPIGLLNHPPDEIRRKFVENWRGVSEIFNLPPAFWQRSIDAVMASYSSSVKSWQLGDDTDSSFVGYPRLSELVMKVKKEFDRIGMVHQIGFFWEENRPLPPKNYPLDTFLSLNTRSETTLQEILDEVKATDNSGHQRWLIIRPQNSENDISLEERAADLMKKMTIAKVSGAEAIFLADVFDEKIGILHPDGSPKELFLPWRTTCLALQNARYLGQLRMPNNSTNYIFIRNNEAIVVVWNKEPVEENIFLGNDVYAENMWGSVIPVGRNQHGEQLISVTSHPLIIRGGQEKILRWMLAINFKKGKLPSSSEFHAEELRGVNTFTNGISGSVTVYGPKDWEIDPKTFNFGLAKDEVYKFPLFIKLPLSTSLGKLPLRLEYNIEDDVNYKFNVLYDYEIGVDDLKLDVKVYPGKEPHQLVLEQIIINNTNPPELLDFRCSLDIPGRRRQEKTITKLGSGQEIKRTYFINNADQLKERRFKVRAEQIDGKRVLNYLYEE